MSKEEIFFKHCDKGVVDIERITVREFWFECNSTRGGSEYCFEVSVDLIPIEKRSAVIKAIEQVLNDDVEDLKIWEREFPKQQLEKLTEQYWAMTDALGQKKYSQKELDEAIANAEEKAFWAGRGGIVTKWVSHDRYKFFVNNISPVDTIEEYRNHPEYKKYLELPHPHKQIKP